MPLSTRWLLFTWASEYRQRRYCPWLSRFGARGHVKSGSGSRRRNLFLSRKSIFPLPVGLIERDIRYAVRRVLLLRNTMHTFNMYVCIENRESDYQQQRSSTPSRLPLTLSRLRILRLRVCELCSIQNEKKMRRGNSDCITRVGTCASTSAM